MLPPGWLLEYVKAHEGYDTVPPALHTFAMMAAFGAMFGRQVRILMGSSHPIDTTQSVVLVAPSGEGKGIAMDRAVMTLKAAAPNFLVTGGKATMEGVLERFDPEDARGLIVAPELGAMFGKQQYRTNFDMEMTDFLDNKNEYQWHTKGTKHEAHEGNYRNVAATLLAGTTATWMRRAMPGTALEEGFASRVFWIRDITAPRWCPTPPPIVPGWAPLANQLQEFYLKIHRQPPTILALNDESQPATKEWLRWYEKYFAAMPVGDPWQRGWWNRKKTFYLQLGLVLSVSKAALCGGPIVLDVESMQGAQRVLEWAEPGIQKIFEEMGRLSPQHEIRMRMLSAIASGGGEIPDSEVHRKLSYHTGLKENTDKMLWELAEAGLIQQKMVSGPEGKRLVRGWGLTSKGKEGFR